MEKENELTQVKTSFNKPLTVKFSDEKMYDEVKSFLDSTNESNAVILTKAIERVKRDNTLNSDLEVLPESLQDIFIGGASQLDVALDMIRSSYSNLAHSSAVELDYRTKKIESVYIKQVNALQKNVDTLTVSEENLKQKLDAANVNVKSLEAEKNKLDETIKQQTKSIEKLEAEKEHIGRSHQLTIKDKVELIGKLKESEAEALRQSSSKDSKIIELEQAIKVLNTNKHEGDKELTELKLSYKLMEQELQMKQKEIERLNLSEHNLTNKIEELIKEHKTEIKELNREAKAEIKELNKTHQSAIKKINDEFELFLKKYEEKVEELEATKTKKLQDELY